MTKHLICNCPSQRHVQFKCFLIRQRCHTKLTNHCWRVNLLLFKLLMSPTTSTIRGLVCFHMERTAGDPDECMNTLSTPLSSHLDFSSRAVTGCRRTSHWNWTRRQWKSEPWPFKDAQFLQAQCGTDCRNTSSYNNKKTKSLKNQSHTEWNGARMILNMRLNATVCQPASESLSWIIVWVSDWFTYWECFLRARQEKNLKTNTRGRMISAKSHCSVSHIHNDSEQTLTQLAQDNTEEYLNNDEYVIQQLCDESVSQTALGQCPTVECSLVNYDCQIPVEQICWTKLKRGSRPEFKTDPCTATTPAGRSGLMLGNMNVCLALTLKLQSSRRHWSHSSSESVE